MTKKLAFADLVFSKGTRCYLVEAKESIDAKDGISIGEAKTCDDLDSDHAKEQLVDYSQRVMTSGTAKDA